MTSIVEESAASSAPQTDKLRVCEVCSIKDAIYTCPKCGVRTCCLLCVRIHKRELECDGIRDRTKFLFVKDFDNLHMLNDYKLLEETSRFMYSKKRNTAKRYTAFNKDIPHHRYKLKIAAKKRGTLLLFLLENFTRHKINSSRLNYKLNTIFWRIEFVFINACPLSVKRIEEKCNEDIRLAKLLNKYFVPDPDVSLAEPLSYYHSAGLNGCRVLMKAERVKKCSKKFHELDPRLSIKENLAGKCIIEFPIIFIVLKDHSYDLDVVDSDVEFENESLPNTQTESSETIDSMTTKYPRQTFTAMFAKQQKIQIENEMAQIQKNEPKNYLFPSGYSSDEEN